jgi:hypothetical protein
MIKRFLVAVLALAAFGLPARADITAYCDGFGCGSNTMAAFTTAVTADGDTYVSVSNITFSAGSLLSSTEYEDTTMVDILDTNGIFTINGTALYTPKGGNPNTVQITVPAGYSSILLSLVDINGAGGFYLDSNENNFVNLSSTPTLVGYTNFGAAGSWTVTILPQGTASDLGITGFDIAGTPQSQGPGGGDTPEVGTLLLIGSGLIGMRWMKGLPRRFFGTPQTA